MSRTRCITDNNMSMLTDDSVRYFSELTTAELRAVLKFAKLVSSQAASLTNINKVKDSAFSVVYTEELKDRAYGYMSKFTNMSGADYILAMMEHPLHQFHLSQFLYSDIKSIYHERDFLDDRGKLFSGISISYDYTQDIPSTDMRTLRDISKRLNVIKEKKAFATCSGDYAVIDDLCDEEDKLLLYVRKAMSKLKLADRARKDYHIVLKSIKRVIVKIRKTFKDEKVADYLSQHIRTGIYCYWDE